ELTIQTYTTTGLKGIIDLRGSALTGFRAGASEYAVQGVRNGGGGATTWSFQLLGSLDCLNFDFTILSVANGSIGANNMQVATGAPALCIRINVSQIGLGGATNIAAHILARN
ncbi:MAG: hypothetical protein ACREYE_12730, partial [Gammaproteobacteria bacterium]